MTRLILMITFAAISLIPQLSEAQLFRRGFRARGARPAQQRNPNLQNFRSNGNAQPRANQRQPLNSQFNSQRLGRGLDALHSVLESTVDGRPITRATSVLQDGGSNQVVTNRPSFENPTGSQVDGATSQDPRKRTYSILIRPDRPAAKGKEDSDSPNTGLPDGDSAQIQLDITTPPLEPVEVIQNNSILQIVETPPKNNGGI